MISNLLVCVEAMLPILITMGIGYLVRLSRMVSDEEIRKFNSLIFHTLFPIMMFSLVYNSDLRTEVDVKTMVFVGAMIVVTFLIATPVVRAMEESPKSRGAMIQASFRSNYVIIGIPVITNIFGTTKVGFTAILALVVVPIFNILAVSTLEYYRGGAGIKAKAILMGLVKNPIIIGTAVGAIFLALNIPLPQVLNSTLSQIASVASPMAIIILGASFKFSAVKENLRNLVYICITRLVAVPAIATALAVLLGIRGLPFVAIIAIFASPCAIASFTMAMEMESDSDLTGNAVVFTSAFSILTIFGWLFLYKSLGMF